MESSLEQNPWEHLSKLIEGGNPLEIEAFLDGLRWSERARAISRLDHDAQERLLTMLDPQEAAELVETLPEHEAADLIERLEPQDAASIVEELESDQQADLLGNLEAESAEAILAEMNPEDAAEARTLSQYASDCAGGLMMTEFVTFPDEFTVHDVLGRLRERGAEYSEYDIQYLYVVDRLRRLVGVLRVRDLLLAPATRLISDLMTRELKTIPASMNVRELAHIFDEYTFMGLPVVDEKGVLIGVVKRYAVDEALVHQSDNAFLAAKGIVGGEEFRTHPLGIRVRRRLSWLGVNIILNMMAVSVIALNQDTLSQVIALAIFLPIISDMSGSAGQQALAVSIRELSLGLVRHTEVFRVVVKEVEAGIINGLSVSIVLGFVAWAWVGNGYMGLVVGAALCLNMVLGVAVGGALPLWVKRFGFDPALVSGLVLTTITDMSGFFFALAFAAQLLPYLT